jgi:outer membrane protein OmpA-like peptidoglycan-associated protein
MKKLFLMLAVAAFSAQTMSAQTAIEESKTFDNWYIGINGGINAPAKGYRVLKNINPEVGLRIGRYFTPVVGFAVEGTARLGDKPGEFSKNAVKSTNVSLLGTVNLSNWFGGYPGAPRSFEVVALAGMGWEHLYGCLQSPNASGEANALTSKAGIDFTFNLGQKKAWQIYLEPNIVWALNRNDHNRVRFSLSDAVVGALVGVNYKFGNSNGTHNFKTYDVGAMIDEIGRLNQELYQLSNKLSEKEDQLAQKDAQIRDLQAALDACNSKPCDPVYVKPATATNLQPTVLFRKGKSVIDPAQYAPIELIASYMKNHPEAKVEVKGYASPEGPLELNNKLSVERANAVMNALIKKYKISADRLSAQGCGPTDELFEELEFNRVATFNDMAK